MANPFIPPKVIAQMKRLGLSETQVLDVWHNGDVKRLSGAANLMGRKYYGREIYLLFTQDKTRGEYTITYVNTRDRR